MYRRFLFATGIENSIPVIDNGWRRMDERNKIQALRSHDGLLRPHIAQPL